MVESGTARTGLWGTSTRILDSARPAAAERYLDVLYAAGFVVYVDRPTRVTAHTAHCIDHILVIVQFGPKVGKAPPTDVHTHSGEVKQVDLATTTLRDLLSLHKFFTEIKRFPEC
ncbi:hypothetical protein J6590_082844 [Homalodisca vitripennis]|nr:hypothetical protein J6590_082844 [Homalodisca vitripennis]